MSKQVESTIMVVGVGFISGLVWQSWAAGLASALVTLAIEININRKRKP